MGDSTMTESLETDEHKRIGPIDGVDDHAGVTFIQKHGDDGRLEEDIWFCLDCGFLCQHVNRFYEVDCERGKNEVNKTWRELSDEVVETK